MLPRLILVFLSVDWPIFSRKPMLTALAEAAKQYGTTVVAVNRPLCPVSTFWRKRSRFMELLRPPELMQVSENLYLYSPKYFLYDRLADKFALLRRFNILALRRSLAKLQVRLGIIDRYPIVWYYHPQQAYVTNIFAHSYNVFELYDNLTDVNGVSDPVVLKWEQEWRSEVDLFLATSPRLLATYGSGYAKTRFLKNGLAGDDYLRLASQRETVGGLLDHIPHPRLGFAGVISERLDWNLILGLAEAKPHWNLVFAGRVTDNQYLAKLRSHSNIHYLGEFPQNRISEIVADFDLGIMPYIDNDFFRFSNPLKFYETCAAGVTSVSSPMEILHDFPAEVVRICPNDITVWISTITAMLGNTGPETRRLCRNIASEHTWEGICADLVKDLLSFLKDDQMRR